MLLLFLFVGFGLVLGCIFFRSNLTSPNSFSGNYVLQFDLKSDSNDQADMSESVIKAKKERKDKNNSRR